MRTDFLDFFDFLDFLVLRRFPPFLPLEPLEPYGFCAASLLCLSKNCRACAVKESDALLPNPDPFVFVLDATVALVDAALVDAAASDFKGGSFSSTRPIGEALPLPFTIDIPIYVADISTNS